MNRAIKSLIISALDPDIYEAIGNAANYSGQSSPLGHDIPDDEVLAALQLQQLRELKIAAYAVDVMRTDGIVAWTR